MDLVPIPAMTVKAREIKANISGGPMYKATVANGAAIRTSTMVEMKSPETDP